MEYDNSEWNLIYLGLEEYFIYCTDSTSDSGIVVRAGASGVRR